MLRLENENLIYKIHERKLWNKKSIYQELDSVYTFHNKINGKNNLSSKVVFYDIIECDDFLSQNISNVSLSSNCIKLKD